MFVFNLIVQQTRRFGDKSDIDIEKGRVNEGVRMFHFETMRNPKFYLREQWVHILSEQTAGYVKFHPHEEVL
jgi:hypothetical protein